MAKWKFNLIGRSFETARTRIKVRGKDGSVRLLTIEEFGEHLRTNAGANSHFGGAILELVDKGHDFDVLCDAVEEALPASGVTYEQDVRQAGAELDAVRSFLVGQGVLSEGDTTTPLGPLLGVLFS